MFRKEILLICLVAVFTSSSATVYTVTSTSTGTSTGTFRWAVSQANSIPLKRDTIYFNINTDSAYSVPIIIDMSSLGSIIDISDTLLIDGSSQPANGYAGPEPKITLISRNVASPTLRT